MWANSQRIILQYFYPEDFYQALENMGLGSGIRDPGSWKPLFRIPDLGVKKAPDPESETLGDRYKKQLKYG